MLLAGASHTGKTVLAQRILERYHVPSLSVDHLKMGLIRSGHTGLTPTSEDEAITALVWPILREMIKTVIENRQQLVVEGCYIPFDWAADFSEAYRREIRYLCLILSDGYIRGAFPRDYGPRQRPGAAAGRFRLHPGGAAPGQRPGPGPLPGARLPVPPGG